MANHQINQAINNHPMNGLKETQIEVVVVMVPLPAQGHLNQLLHLSRHILSYNIPVHFVSTTTHNRQARLRAHGWNPCSASNIHFHDFKVPPFNSPPPNPNSSTNFPCHLQPSFDASKHLREPVSALLCQLSCQARKVIVIHDSLMRFVTQEVALISNAESYVFHSVSAFTIYMFYMEGREMSVEANEVIPQDVPSLDGCFSNEFMDFIASQYEFHEYNSGNLYNTSKSIEGVFIDLLQKETLQKGINHWALGPFNPVKIESKEAIDKARNICLEWLDKQERNSVIYVSFGTTTVLKDEQIKELAIGLKHSNQKFIWVLRDADKADVFDGDERRTEFPKWHEESIEENGLIVRDWAPQLEILAHPATGGFMSHCGWNSCMESITMGVPIAAWPMHSDQPRNTVLITKILKIGYVVKDWAQGWDQIVTSNIVENVVNRLMASKEGDEMRKRAAEFGETLRRSMGEDGVSRMEMDSFIAHISK